MKSLRDNLSQFSRITLVDKYTIIIYNNKMQDDFQWSWISENFWLLFFSKNAVGNLEIKEIVKSPEVNRTSPHDSVDFYIWKYRDHRSIKWNWVNVSFVNPFFFSEIAEKRNCRLKKKFWIWILKEVVRL